MTAFDRRAFLAGLGKAGAALAAGTWMQAIGYAQTRGPARAFVRRLPGRMDLDRHGEGATRTGSSAAAGQLRETRPSRFRRDQEPWTCCNDTSWQDTAENIRRLRLGAIARTQRNRDIWCKS